MSIFLVFYRDYMDYCSFIDPGGMKGFNFKIKFFKCPNHNNMVKLTWI